MFSCLLLYSCMCVLQTAWMGTGCLFYFGKTPGNAEALQNASCNQISLCVLVCVCSFFLLFVIGVECKVTVSDPHECRSSSLTVNWVLLAVG